MNVHILVAHAFLDNYKDGPIVNHKDGVKTNNNITNLEFITQSDNNKHAIANGLRKIYTIEVEQYNLKGKLLNTYCSITEASQKTGTPDNRISEVCKGKRKKTNNYIWKYKNSDIQQDNTIDFNNRYYIRAIDDYPGYYVTNDGKIYSTKFERYLKLKNDGAGYVLTKLYVNGIGKDVLVHRVVAEHFLDKAHTTEVVNHKNKDKSDNRVVNLGWATHSENMIHANAH